MNNILELDSVIMEFDSRRILQDVYLKSETGKVTGLLGRNGTGKSCIFKILFGELRASSQSIRINDRALIKSDRSPKEVRYLPQENCIPSSLTVRRVLEDFDIDFVQLIKDFPQFHEHYYSKLIHLSSGQRRIIEIYVILTSKTQFCLLDEPFSQIMPIHVDTIKAIIQREKSNKGVIISDHMYRHIIDLCDDLYVINNGTTYLTNSTQDLATMGYVRIAD